MSQIRLDEQTILFEDAWLTKGDLKAQIESKMQAGEMNFANLAIALEELTTALENAHTIEIKLTLPKDQYQKLRARGGEKDLECVKKAIAAYIRNGHKPQKPVGDATPEIKAEPTPAPQADPADSDLNVQPPPIQTESENGAKAKIRCSVCQTAIEFAKNAATDEIQCPQCNTKGRIKKKSKTSKKFRNHILA